MSEVKHWSVVAIAVVVLWTGTSPRADGQAPDGYFYGPRADLPATLVQGGDSARFRVRISRSADSDWERELMERAESLYPPPELIADSVDAHLADPRNRIGVWEERFAEAAAAPGPRWWWLLRGDLGLPFALTGQTVAQYLEHFRSLRGGPNPYAEYNPGVEHTAELLYAATVRSKGTGYIVEMALRWSFRCGGLCGLRLEHTRRVELDGAGRVVRVEGDRQPSYLVS